MEKWKKLLVLAAVFYLLHMYLVETIGWSSPTETGPPIVFASRIIAPLFLLWAISSWENLRKQNNRWFRVEPWKEITILAIFCSATFYVFTLVICLNPGFLGSPSADLFFMIGFFFWGTVSLISAAKILSNQRMREDFSAIRDGV